MTKGLLLLIAGLLPILLSAQRATQRITVSGYIENQASKERLIGVNIFDESGKHGTVTNNYGFFSLTMPIKDSAAIIISYVGFSQEHIVVKRDTFITIGISEIDESLSKVIVSTRIPDAQRSQMSSVTIDIKQAKKIPALFDEVDILRTIQYLPDVQSGAEGNIGLYVRGGRPDQNLILLDGVPVYNVGHLFGFYSVFNADAIKSATIIKAGFPQGMEADLAQCSI